MKTDTEKLFDRDDVESLSLAEEMENMKKMLAYCKATRDAAKSGVLFIEDEKEYKE